MTLDYRIPLLEGDWMGKGAGQMTKRLAVPSLEGVSLVLRLDCCNLEEVNAKDRGNRIIALEAVFRQFSTVFLGEACIGGYSGFPQQKEPPLINHMFINSAWAGERI